MTLKKLPILSVVRSTPTIFCMWQFLFAKYKLKRQFFSKYSCHTKIGQFCSSTRANKNCHYKNCHIKKITCRRGLGQRHWPYKYDANKVLCVIIYIYQAFLPTVWPQLKTNSRIILSVFWKQNRTIMCEANRTTTCYIARFIKIYLNYYNICVFD